MNYANFLGESEKVGLKVINTPDFSVTEITHPDRSDGDCVFIDIAGETDHCVWIGDKPLKIKVLSGFGRLATMSVETGQFRDHVLEPDTETSILPGTAYFYRNLGHPYRLLIRDETEGFDPDNEPIVAEYFGTE